MSNVAGKVLLMPKGEYNASTTYEVNDTVYYLTNSAKGIYVAKKTTTGNAPTDTTNWYLYLDLSNFISDTTAATLTALGLVKPDGMTTSTTVAGILTALGVAIKADIHSGGVEYGSDWLEVNGTVITPSNKQMYRVTLNNKEYLYFWNGTNYVAMSGGHTIMDNNGALMDARSRVQFNNMHITDDNVNDKTVITPVDMEQLLRKTVGWTGKNLLAFPYAEDTKFSDGITFTVNSDGSVTVSGTATSDTNMILATIDIGGITSLAPATIGDYILTDGNVPGVSDATYGLKYNATNHNFYIFVKTGEVLSNVTFYPMLRKADIIDDTYEPYHKDVATLLAEMIISAGVASFNGRVGQVMPASGDYDASQIRYNNDTLEAFLNGIGNSLVKSFNSRNGAVVPTDGDYDAGKITFDGTETGINATRVQGAIDEMYKDFQVMIVDTSYLDVVRNKNLGTKPTTEQLTALAKGDVTWAYNGDYWNDGTRIWRIVDNTEWWSKRGSANRIDKPHLVVFPDSNLIAAEAYLISANGDATYGYGKCAYRTRTDGKGRAKCLEICQTFAGSAHVLTGRRELVSTSKDANGATGWGWTDGNTIPTADVELPSEVNIYGHSVWAEGKYGNGWAPNYNIGTNWGQWMLYRLAPKYAINNSQNYWLRDIVNASGWAFVTYFGVADFADASNPYFGLRPFFILV